MNYRLKFRAWHKKCEMMFDVWKVGTDGSCQCYNLEVFDDGYCGVRSNGVHDCFAINSGNAGYISSNNCVLMQCTGLKDKNGNLIFEGDIVEWLDRTGIIEFVPGEFIVKWNKDASSYNERLRVHSGNLKIVGNIYENSELLTSK